MLSSSSSSQQSRVTMTTTSPGTDVRCGPRLTDRGAAISIVVVGVGEGGDAPPPFPSNGRRVRLDPPGAVVVGVGVGVAVGAPEGAQAADERHARHRARRHVAPVERAPGARAVGRPALDGRSQQPRAHHGPASRRRPQTSLPDHRLQAQDRRHGGHRRAPRVRPEPHRLHCPGAVRRGGGEGVAPGVHRGAARRPGRVARAGVAHAGAGHRPRERHGAAPHPAGHRDPQPGGVPGARRPDGAHRRRLLRPAGEGRGRRVRRRPHALQGGAHVPPGLPGHGRRRRQRRAQVRQDREGGALPVDGTAPARARRRHEPGRPPDGRRRRQDERRAPVRVADRPAGQGLQDAVAEEVDAPDRAASRRPPGQEGRRRQVVRRAPRRGPEAEEEEAAEGRQGEGEEQVERVTAAFA